MQAITCKHGITPKGQCKECKSERARLYFHQNPAARERRSERHREYYQRPEVKEHILEHQRGYRQRPEVKEHILEHQKEYYQRPEVKEHRAEYHKEYSQRPEIKEHQKAYRQQYWKAYRYSQRASIIYVIRSIRSTYSRMEKDAEKEIAEAERKYGYIPIALEGKLVMAREIQENLDMIHDYIAKLDLSPEIRDEAELQLINNLLEKEGMLVSRRERLPA